MGRGWIVLLLAACGHGHNDRPALDASADSLPADAPVDADDTTVVTVLDIQSNPLSGIDVYFQDADSTLTQTLTTDAAGQVSAHIASGGFISVGITWANQPAAEVYTFSNVVAGEALWVQQPDTFHDHTISIDPPLDTSLAVSFSDLPQQDVINSSMEIESTVPHKPYTFLNGFEITPTAGVASTTLLVPSGQTLIFETNFDHTGNIQNTLIDWMPTTTSYTLDVISVMPHPFTTLPTNNGTSIDWAEGSDGVDAQYDHALLELGTSQWQILGHAGATTSLAVPVLPAAIAFHDDPHIFHLQYLETIHATLDVLPQRFASTGGGYDATGPQGRVASERYESN